MPFTMFCLRNIIAILTIYLIELMKEHKVSLTNDAAMWFEYLDIGTNGERKYRYSEILGP